MKVSQNLDREWRPGDVAMVDSGNGFRPARVGQLLSDGNLVWRFLDTNTWVPLGSNVRPLVVIDPEDREQIGQLRDLYDVAVIRMNNDPDPRDVTPEQRTTAMQSAFLSLANPKPPKPEEPTGLGAVVEDADGMEWTRAGRKSGNTWYRAHGHWSRYADIDVVRVLSEGVEVESQ